MKLSELAYKRPDLEAMIEAFGKLEARAEGAQSPGELEACILEGNGLRRELIDLCNLCGIRFEEDIRVTFYAEEYEYLNSARPGVDEAYLRFRKAAAANPHRKALKEKIPRVYFQASETLVSMSSPQLLALMGEEGRLRAEYQRLIGVISIPFKGQKYTTMQMSRFFNAPDPETREEAYMAAGEVLKRHAAPIGELFVRLVALRNEMARLLGFDSYTQLAYRLKTRCYTPGEVEGYRGAVKKHIVPLVSRLRQAQGARLGLDRLRFSDQGVFSPGGNPRLVQAGPPFFQQTFEVLRDLCPETREMADRMLAAGTFDLDAREGKAAGGHCGYLYGIETPYVFANFSGTSFDVTGLTHECGHALAAYLAKDLPLAGELDPTYDTAAPRIGSYDMAETHSGTMEFLCWPYFERFSARMPKRQG